MRRMFGGEPSSRSGEHFDWLMARPGERTLCAEDDARFDADRIAARLTLMFEPIPTRGGG